MDVDDLARTDAKSLRQADERPPDAHEASSTTAPPPPPYSPGVSPAVLTATVRAVDIAVVAVSGAAAYLVYLDQSFSGWGLYLFAIVFGAILQINVFQNFGLYRYNNLRSLAYQVGTVVAAWATVIIALIVLAYFTKTSEFFSRAWVVLWAVFGLVGFQAARAAMRLFVFGGSRGGRFKLFTAVVGGGEAGRQLVERMEATAGDDIEIVGIFDDRQTRLADFGAHQRLGSVGDLVDYARNHRVDMIVVSLPMRAEERILQFLKKLWVLPIPIRLSPQTSGLRFSPQSYTYIGDVPLLNVFDRPLDGWSVIVKAAEDYVLGTLFLIFVAPLMVLIALAVKLDSPGPVFFRQKRYGFNNELIEVFKFRTLRHDQTDANASRLVTRNDPRVTRVGAFLRKTSLDELPQLINVVRGEMSLVGPRAHALEAKAGDRLYQDVVDGYFARHRVKPGITGWAQVNGWRGETDVPEKIEGRLESDLYYIEHWSVWFDLRIMAMTPIALLRTEQAY